MSCDFNNDTFFDYIDELKRKKGGRNYRLSVDELTRFITIHLRDNSPIKRIMSKDWITLQEMKCLARKCTGVVNLELTGSGKYIGDNLRFNINKKNVNFDLTNDVPNVDADLTRKIVWHLHPWNVSLDYNRNIPNFFSLEDIRVAIDYPNHIFIIFNMSCQDPRIPVIYLVWADKGIKKNIAKKKLKDIYPDINFRLLNGDHQVDFFHFKKEMKEAGLNFHFLYRYDERSIKRILDNPCGY